MITIFEMPIIYVTFVEVFAEIASWLSTTHLDVILLHIAVERILKSIEAACRRIQCNTYPANNNLLSRSNSVNFLTEFTAHTSCP